MSDIISERKPIPLLCRLFGHKWVTFDSGWCGRDYQICYRLGFHPLRTCGSTRGTDHG